jgi:hypothetical protein
MKGRKKEIANQIVLAVSDRFGEPEQQPKKIKAFVKKVAKKLADKIRKAEKRADKKAKKEFSVREMNGGGISIQQI